MTPSTGLTVVVLTVGLILYLLPWIVAANRDHHNSAAIGVLNVLLGWTGLGWVIALVWAATAVKREPPTSGPAVVTDRQFY